MLKIWSIYTFYACKCFFLDVKGQPSWNSTYYAIDPVIAGDKSADSAAKLADVAKAEETGSSEAAPEESKHGEDEDMKVGLCAA